MKYRKLGNTKELLPALGLGIMGVNHGYGDRNDEESVATLNLALDLGINFWDTADMYADGENEKFVSQFLVPNRNRVFLATKFGFRKQADGSLKVDGSPTYIKTAVEASLKRLRTDHIDLYYAHRVDPSVPIEETVGAMADLVKEGKVRYIGLSEASPNSIRRAHAVHPVSALQSEYSILTRTVESEILPLTKELGISLVPFSPLARGLVTNTLDVTALAADDMRRTLPRYQEAFAENNRQLAAGFQEIADGKGATPAQLALAWVLAQGDQIIPIPGTKKRKYLADNAGALEVTLTAADLSDIEALLKKYPNTGARYNPEMEAMANR